MFTDHRCVALLYRIPLVNLNNTTLLKDFKLIVSSICLALTLIQVQAQTIVSASNAAGTYDIAQADIYVDADDIALVKKSATLLQQDLEMITGRKPSIVHNIYQSGKTIIIIGSLQNSTLIKILVQQKKLHTASLKNKWEAYQLQTITEPFKGVNNALVIIGSDRRGTAFGVFELSKQIGVSPWYWWADVPATKKRSIYIQKGITLNDAPKVKYRGIFINDEAPALSNWSKEKFGGFNHKFYAKVFELMLRLKSNYIWPAMWGNAFYDDDSLNIKTADEYGIVIGTSHHEPLMRAHDEWRRYGEGKWNYDSNAVRLKAFWRKGMETATNEKIVSIGMRGDGDEPMSRETATALLEKIVKDQRIIINEVTGKPAAATPQLWALYKEVQDYYDKGMRVPDDVTLLLCDDNWGNIRKLPKIDDKPRSGGYGIYYHFDYVGGPRNYKWINTNPIARVWEQMHLAWEYNVRQIWIVNVGDIKPMEFPISFFLDYAWNPEKIGANDLQKYTEHWAAAQFGKEYAEDIADVIATYSKYNGRRKPELLDAKTYSLENFDEFKKVQADYKALVLKAGNIKEHLEPEYHDAFFQLVQFPVMASANLNEMYYNAALNMQAYKKRYAIANEYADNVKNLYIEDSLLTTRYHQFNNGKWNHMMSQTHIGYTYWQQPQQQKMPTVIYVAPDSAVKEKVTTAMEIPTAKKLIPANSKGNIFYQEDNYVSIEADHFTRAINGKGISWKILPDLGKTGNAITSFPVTSASQAPATGAPNLQYDIYTFSEGAVTINAYFSPTLNFHNTATGLQYGISVDDEAPQIISINKEDNNGSIWNKWVGNNIIIKNTTHQIATPGKHTIKYWLVNPGVVLQKIVAHFGDLQISYLGPPETKN
ncbi:hypothetical protein BH11BAC3_BH11BAC3_06440 [soil metagenome]